MRALRAAMTPEELAASLASLREWTARNPDRVSSSRRRRRERNWRVWRAYDQACHLKNTFGIGIERYREILAAQNGRCAICGSTEPRATVNAGPSARFCLDHDHRFSAKDPRGHRGLLCQPCNRGLAAFEDDVARMKKAIEYVHEHRTSTAGR
jgi:hypothetical protein